MSMVEVQIRSQKTENIFSIVDRQKKELLQIQKKYLQQLLFFINHHIP